MLDLLICICYRFNGLLFFLTINDINIKEIQMKKIISGLILSTLTFSVFAAELMPKNEFEKVFSLFKWSKILL